MRLLRFMSVCLLLLAGCAAGDRGPAYASAHDALRAGMSRAEAERLLLPHAETAAMTLNSPGAAAPIREYFALPGEQQTWIDLRDDTVVRVGPIEAQTNWFRAE